MRSCKAIIAVLLVPVCPSTVHLQSRQQSTTVNSNLLYKVREARSVVAQAKAAALKIGSGFERGLVLDQIGEAEAKAGDLDAAVVTANQAYPHTYATLVAIGEQLGNSNNTVKAKSIGLTLRGGGSSTVLACLAQRQAEKGNINEAMQTAKQISAPEVRSDALEWIARQQAANGEYAGMRETLALARAAYPAKRFIPDYLEMMMAASQLSRGDMQAARATLASMKSAESRFSVMMSGAEELLKRADNGSALAWLADAFREVPAEQKYDFLRYFAIPLQVRLGQKERAMQAASMLSPDLRVRGYMAVAVVCVEAKDVAGMNAALEKMRSSAASEGDDKDLSDFGVKLMILNVTAALIDHSEFEMASLLITSVEENLDDVSKMSIEPKTQLLRVFALAQQDRFDDARSLAMRMRRNSVADDQRGTALRTVALLRAKKQGVFSTRRWALVLQDPEDRAYTLLGIAQAVLGINDPKVGYSAISVH